LLLGGEYILLQIFQYVNYIEIIWNKEKPRVFPLENASELIDEQREQQRKRSQNLSVENAIGNRLKSFFMSNIPFKAGLLTGFMIGYTVG